MTSAKQMILTELSTRRQNGKPAPTSQRLYDMFNGKLSVHRVDETLGELQASGAIVCTNGLWHERGVPIMRKPKGPKRLDPKSAEARTLPLPLYGVNK